MNHWLRQAFYDGLNILDIDELLAQAAVHITAKGEWQKGVVSPSLVGRECRLARLKQFLGDDPQPGYQRQAVRAGKPDPITQLNFARGFFVEGVVISAITAALGPRRIMGHAPTLVFRWRYRGSDFLLSNWQGRGLTFAGHPDLLLWSPDAELELVQIKSPAQSKFERIARKGDEETLNSWRPQMVTEMYIARKMGYPVKRSHLFLSSTDGTPKQTDPFCRIVTLDWSEEMANIPEEVGRELVQDYDAAYTQQQWPRAYPEHRWDVWPCSYCKWARLGDFETIGCHEQGEWERYEKTGETRLTVPTPPHNDPKIVPLRSRKRSA